MAIIEDGGGWNENIAELQAAVLALGGAVEVNGVLSNTEILLLQEQVNLLGVAAGMGVLIADADGDLGNDAIAALQHAVNVLQDGGGGGVDPGAPFIRLNMRDLTGSTVDTATTTIAFATGGISGDWLSGSVELVFSGYYEGTVTLDWDDNQAAFEAKLAAVFTVPEDWGFFGALLDTVDGVDYALSLLELYALPVGESVTVTVGAVTVGAPPLLVGTGVPDTFSYGEATWHDDAATIFGVGVLTEWADVSGTLTSTAVTGNYAGNYTDVPYAPVVSSDDDGTVVSGIYDENTIMFLPVDLTQFASHGYEPTYSGGVASSGTATYHLDGHDLTFDFDETIASMIAKFEAIGFSCAAPEPDTTWLNANPRVLVPFGSSAVLTAGTNDLDNEAHDTFTATINDTGAEAGTGGWTIVQHSVITGTENTGNSEVIPGPGFYGGGLTLHADAYEGNEHFVLNSLIGGDPTIEGGPHVDESWLWTLTWDPETQRLTSHIDGPALDPQTVYVAGDLDSFDVGDQGLHLFNGYYSLGYTPDMDLALLEVYDHNLIEAERLFVRQAVRDANAGTRLALTLRDEAPYHSVWSLQVSVVNGTPPGSGSVVWAITGAVEDELEIQYDDLYSIFSGPSIDEAALQTVVDAVLGPGVATASEPLEGIAYLTFTAIEVVEMVQTANTTDGGFGSGTGIGLTLARNA